jgi:DNA-binding winged helix-turn-helix (wHTH) protein
VKQEASAHKRVQLPLSFREEAVTSILDCLTAGESCAVVGIGSVGKSNLLRFLQREDVLADRLGEECSSFLLVYIDANKLLKRSLWGLTELMLHQLMASLTDRGVDKKALRRLEGLYDQAVEPTTKHLALRYLDRALALVCGQLGLHVAFLLDEFGDLCQMLSSRGFAALRAFRDDHKYQLMYVVATRLEPSRLREDVRGMEAFEELVSVNVVWLGPYSESDARFMLHRLKERHGLQLSTEDLEHLLTVTGGHPGLLRACYRNMSENAPNLGTALLSSSQVQDECKRIWFSLTREEQKAIAQIAYHGSAPGEITHFGRLRRKGLVGGPWVRDDQVFSLLFAQYIQEHQPVAGAHIVVDRGRRIVWVDGRAVRDLSPLEFSFIDWLDQKRGAVCSRDELASYLYPEETELDGGGATDARLDAVAKRVRSKVEVTPKRPRYIVTVRGHGYRLVDDTGDT